MSTASDVEHVGRMDAIEARALTDRIKVGVEAVWELIKQAYTERAWDALGYSSWDDYCTREFGTSRLRLPREERPEVVSSLRDSGLSIRAIATATQIDPRMVRRDLAQVGRNAPPELPVDADTLADELIAIDEALNGPSAPGGEPTAECIHCNRTLPLSQLYEGGGGYECDPCVSPDDVPESPESAPAPVIGLDGKKYQPSRPAPKPSQKESAPRRRPLTDVARELGLDLKNITARMERLLADDRFARNKSEVAPHLRFHLAEAIRVCQDLDHQINQ